MSGNAIFVAVEFTWRFFIARSASHSPSKADGPDSYAYSEVVSFRGTGKCCAGRCFISARYTRCEWVNYPEVESGGEIEDSGFVRNSHCAFPQKPTAEIAPRTPRWCHFAGRVGFVYINAMLPRGIGNVSG